MTVKEKIYRFTLYVAGRAPKSLLAIANLKRLCAEHLAGRHKIVVVDVARHPEKASKHQIFALPTLVRDLPVPIRKILGDLSNRQKALVSLDLA